MTKVWYICRENTARSAAAMIIHRAEAERRGITGLEVDSAGLRRGVYGYIIPEVIRALNTLSYSDYGRYEPKEAKKEMFGKGDLVLCMTPRHRDAMKKLVPSLEGRIYTLQGYCGVKGDGVEDPGLPSKKTRYSPPIRILPLPVRVNIYQRVGWVDENDLDARDRLYLNTMKEIQTLVLRALDRLKRDESISAGTKERG